MIVAARKELPIERSMKPRHQLDLAIFPALATSDYYSSTSRQQHSIADVQMGLLQERSKLLRNQSDLCHSARQYLLTRNAPFRIQR